MSENRAVFWEIGSICPWARAQPRGAKLQAQGRISATNGELIFTLPRDVFKTTLIEHSTSGNGSSIDDFQLTLIVSPAALFAFAPSLHGARLLPWRQASSMALCHADDVSRRGCGFQNIRNPKVNFGVDDHVHTVGGAAVDDAMGIGKAQIPGTSGIEHDAAAVEIEFDVGIGHDRHG